MLTKFEGIPRQFIELYRRELEYWARNFGRRGPMQQIVLRKEPSNVLMLNPDPAMGEVIEFVTLVAEHQTNVATRETRMLIRPHGEDDREKIERHVRGMRVVLLN